MRKRGRTDANQKEIVTALRRIGASVAITSSVGSGFPDLVVGYHGRNYLVELKDGSKPLSQRALTQDEVKFIDEWRGEVVVINSIDEALKYFSA